MRIFYISNSIFCVSAWLGWLVVVVVLLCCCWWWRWQWMGFFSPSLMCACVCAYGLCMSMCFFALRLFFWQQLMCSYFHCQFDSVLILIRIPSFLINIQYASVCLYIRFPHPFARKLFLYYYCTAICCHIHYYSFSLSRSLFLLMLMLVLLLMMNEYTHTYNLSSLVPSQYISFR